MTLLLLLAVTLAMAAPTFPTCDRDWCWVLPEVPTPEIVDLHLVDDQLHALTSDDRLWRLVGQT